VRAVQVLIEASRTRDFWLLAGSFFVCGASTKRIDRNTLHRGGVRLRHSEVKSASLLMFMGIFDLVGTTASGWLSDRFNCRYLLFTYYGLRGLSLLFFCRRRCSVRRRDWHVRSVLRTRLDRDRATDGAVDGRSVRSGKGEHRVRLVVASHQVGAAFAAYAAGALRTQFGSYQYAFLARVRCALSPH